jgi:hypothetical protein
MYSHEAHVQHSRLNGQPRPEPLDLAAEGSPAEPGQHALPGAARAVVFGEQLDDVAQDLVAFVQDVVRIRPWDDRRLDSLQSAAEGTQIAVQAVEALGGPRAPVAGVPHARHEPTEGHDGRSLHGQLH